MALLVCVAYPDHTPLPHRVIAEEHDENELLADVLTVLKQLVKYGYYDDAEDVDNVLVPLTKILSGFSDKMFNTEINKRTNGVYWCMAGVGRCM